VDRSRKNSGGAITFPQIILDAIRIPKDQWTNHHKDAALAITPLLLNLACSVLCGFGQPTDYHHCLDTIQTWWDIVISDRALSLKEQHGFSKYARVMMKRAASQVANRRGSRHIRSTRRVKKNGANKSASSEAVAPIAARPSKRRVLAIHAAANVFDRAPTPPDRAHQQQTNEAVAAEFNRLRASLREPMVCYYYEGLTTEETAEKLEVSPNAIAQRLFHARNILRRRLSRFDPRRE
jgi:RNA polymerase sigma factor (sigma-70 family)